MSTAHVRNTRATSHPRITEQDIQDQLRSDADNDDSLMGLEPHSPMASSSGSSHNDDPMDLSYPLPILPMSSIQVADIDSELCLTRDQSEELHMVVRSSMRHHGILGSLDFRNRVGTEHALKPVLKDVKAELAWLDAKARKKGSPGTARLGDLLCARARLIDGAERRRTRELSKDVGVDQEQVGEAHRAIEDGGCRDGASGVAALDGAGVHDAPAANLLSPQTRTHGHVRAIALPPFCPSSFIVRVEGNTNGAAILTTQLNTARQADPPTSIDNMSLDRFLELVSDELGYDVHGRIFAVLPKTSTIAAVDTRIKMDSVAKWMAVLQHWQTWRRRTCEFVVKMEDADA